MTDKVKIKEYIDTQNYSSVNEAKKAFGNKYSSAVEAVVNEKFEREVIKFKRSKTTIIYNRKTDRTYVFRITSKGSRFTKQKAYSRYINKIKGKEKKK